MEPKHSHVINILANKHQREFQRAHLQFPCEYLEYAILFSIWIFNVLNKLRTTYLNIHHSETEFENCRLMKQLKCASTPFSNAISVEIHLVFGCFYVFDVGVAPKKMEFWKYSSSASGRKKIWTQIKIRWRKNENICAVYSILWILLFNWSWCCFISFHYCNIIPKIHSTLNASIK